jgi:hypothetical protein
MRPAGGRWTFERTTSGTGSTGCSRPISHVWR